MKYEIDLNVNLHELYQLLINSACQDIKQLNPEITLSQIQPGFTYQKTLTGMIGQKAIVEVTILKLQEDKCYAVSFASERGVTTTRYELEEVDGKVRVKYEETFVSGQKSSQLNYNLMSFLYKKSSAKKLRNKFRQLESYLQAQGGVPCQD